MAKAWQKAAKKGKECEKKIKELDKNVISELIKTINYADNQNHCVDYAETEEALENAAKMKKKLEEARDNHYRRSDELYVDSVRKKCDNKMKALKQSAEALNLFNSDDEESDQE